MRPTRKREKIIPKMIKCRTCLEPSEVDTSVNITKEYILGRSIKDILLTFIPEMITSPIIDEFMCLKCIRRLRSFTNFIEKCLTVEKFLVEEIAKTQKKIEKEQRNNNINDEVSFVYISVPPANRNGVQNGVQPIQIHPLPISYLLASNNNSTINIGNGVTQIQEIANQSASQSQLVLLPEITNDDSAGVVTRSSLNDTNESNEAEINHSPRKKQTTVGNRLCRTCGDVFTSDDWAVVECSKCTGSDHELEFIISDLPSNGSDNDDDLGMEIEKMSVSEKKTGDRKNKTVFKILRSEFRDTVISIPQSPDEVGEFMEEFSNANVNLIEYNSFNHTENKRILLLGNSSTQCPECKALLMNPKLLKSHFREAHTKQELHIEEGDNDTDDKKTYECPFCETKVHTALLLVEHLRQTHTIENPFQCEKCGREFKKRDVYLDHIKRYENTPDCLLRKCRFCDEMLGKTEYDEHLKNHRNIVCDQCGKDFLSVHTFKLHYATHQGEDKKLAIKKKSRQTHLCPICGKLLSNPQSWRLHMTIHGHRTRNYICHMCPKTFLTSYYLKSHIASAHVEKNIACPICGIKVKTKTALINHHNLKHSENYAHQCKICGQGFTRGDYFRRHMSKHAAAAAGRTSGKKKYNYSVKIESKPVKCKYCLKIFKNVYLLRTHLLSHVKSMRYKCKFCNMTFANTGTRFRHQKRHADPNFELSCTVCWKRMDTQEELELHLSRHDDSKKYECVVCEELFCSKYLLRHHMSDQHIPQEEVEKEKETVLSTALEEFLL